MTHYQYERYKSMWEETKPIRGRADDVRPIGERRRDWELVVRGVESADKDGEVVYWYGAQLYQTVVVKYLSNGEVVLNIDHWNTMSTSDFMQKHGPFRTVRKNSMIWIRVPHNGGGVKHIPIPENTEVRLKWERGTDDGPSNWHLLTELKVKQRIIDRAKSKEIRDKIRKFTKYAETMLKLSDGWIRAETLAPYRTEQENSWGYVSEQFDFRFDANIQQSLKGYITKFDAPVIIDLLSVENYDVWDRAMYCILHDREDGYRVVREKEIPTKHGICRIQERDLKYSPQKIHGFITKLVREFDVYAEREVETENMACIPSNVVV